MFAKQEISVLQKSFSTGSLAIGGLSVLYLVGIAGIITHIHPIFILFTPIHLLLSLFISLAFHPGSRKDLRFFVITCYLISFGAELYGVQTGLLFGAYVYGRVLGPKIGGTPLLIGVNWILLIYSIGITVNHLSPKWHWLPKSLVATALLVGLDVLIEPVATRYGFWSWKQGIAPLQNYLGWCLVALPLLCIFTKTQGKARNKVAVALFILQILFFGILNLV